MAANRVSGMISGMDTESLVQAYVSSYVAKKEKLQKAQTKLSWKQDAWKALNTKVYSTYTKIGNMRLSSSYNLRKTNVSDATKATVTATSSAVNGTQSLKIKQLAKSGYLTGAQLKKNTTTQTKLSDLGYTGGDTTIALKVGEGSSKSIEINGDSTIGDVLKSLKDAGVNASYDEANRRIFVAAKESGTANDFGLTATSDAGTSALSALGLLTTASADMTAYAKNAAYAKGIDASGNVVDYYQLDDDGNIRYDEDGKAIVNAGVTYSKSATEAAIADVLTNIASKYDDNNSLNAEKSSLQARIAYTEVKDAIDKASEGKDADKVQELIKLIKASADGAKYIDDEGGLYSAEYISKTSGAEYTRLDGETVSLSDLSSTPAAIDKKIESLAKELGFITTKKDDMGQDEDDKTAYTAFENNVKSTYKVEKDHEEGYENTYRLDEDGISSAKDRITEINSTIEDNTKYIADNKYFDQDSWKDYHNEVDGTVDSDKIRELAGSLIERVDFGASVVNGDVELSSSQGATRVSAQDAIIYLNDAEFTSSSNKFNVNGLSITATGVTGDDEITVTTSTDTQGIYDKIKDFITAYNELVNELQGKYNSASAKSYEPLTDDEKEAMSEKEIEKWETTIKDSLLRRDSTLGNLINNMTATMLNGVSINGKQYNLSSFGIQTQGYLNAAKNEQYAYHIDGDSEDDVSASKADKLMAMIESDPDTVSEFFSKLASNLYDKVGNLMKSTTVSSTYTVYNDKEMASEYSNYTKLIKQWTEKIEDMEDRYYKQFASMESQLAKMQNATSSISSLFAN